MGGFLISIPIPPSVNKLYYNRAGKGGGRAKTPDYRSWQVKAGWEVKAQNPTPVKGPYKLYLTLPKGMSGDPNNRVKAVFDLLVNLQLIEGDSIKYDAGHKVDSSHELHGYALVSVEPYQDQEAV